MAAREDLFNVLAMLNTATRKATEAFACQDAGDRVEMWKKVVACEASVSEALERLGMMMEGAPGSP